MLSKGLVALLITLGISAEALTLVNIVSCGSHVLSRPSKRHHEQASPCLRILPLRRVAAISGSFEAGSDGEGALSRVYDRSYGSLVGAMQMCTGGSGEPRGSYVDVTVREAVEWTMRAKSEFHYIDVRSPEEHKTLSPPRGSVGIPAFELVPLPRPEGDGADEDETGGQDYEQMEWKPVPDFVDREAPREEIPRWSLVFQRIQYSGRRRPFVDLNEDGFGAFEELARKREIACERADSKQPETIV